MVLSPERRPRMTSRTFLRAVVWVMAGVSVLGLGASIVQAQIGLQSFWTVQTYFDLQRIQGLDAAKNKFNILSHDHVWNRGTQTACVLAQHFPEDGVPTFRFFSVPPGQAVTYRPYPADEPVGRGFTRYLSLLGTTTNGTVCAGAVQGCVKDGTCPFYADVEFDHEQSANTCGKGDAAKCNLYCPATQKGYTGSAKYRIPVATGFLNATTAAASVPPATVEDCSPCSNAVGRCLGP
jgi:hypothetical protein